MKVKLDSKEIEVVKLPIGKYAELLNALKGLPAKLDIEGLSNSSNEALFTMLPTLIANNLPEAIRIISIGSGLPESEVAELGLSECIDLLMAIAKVNNYAEVYEKLKKGLARLPKTPVKTGSPVPLTH